VNVRVQSNVLTTSQNCLSLRSYSARPAPSIDPPSHLYFNMQAPGSLYLALPFLKQRIHYSAQRKTPGGGLNLPGSWIFDITMSERKRRPKHSWRSQAVLVHLKEVRQDVSTDCNEGQREIRDSHKLRWKRIYKCRDKLTFDLDNYTHENNAFDPVHTDHHIPTATGCLL
jgi:hypothetical protein